MRIVALVQARYSSQRLPGKVLRCMVGRPMLDWLLESLAHAEGLQGIRLATSTESSDDAVADYAAGAGEICHRGPLDDVARRLLDAAQAASADALVRISGDSPLMDPIVVSQAVRLFREGNADIVSNVRPRSFPKGQSVEIIATPALRRAVSAMDNAYDREHVTPYLYAHPDEFPLRSFQAERPQPDLQLSVDDESDFRRAEAILSQLDRPHWSVGWEMMAALSLKAAA
jgi:spore coat polysaccharide biosynthesis protein SpsF